MPTHLWAMTAKAKLAKAVMVAVAAVVVVVAVAANPRVATPKALLAKRVRPLSRRRPTVAPPATKSPHPVANVNVSPVASVNPVAMQKKPRSRLRRRLA